MRSIVKMSVLGLLLGCGGGSSSGFHPSVAGSKPLNQLSDADARSLCAQSAAYVQAQVSSPAVIENQCRLTGALFALLTISDTATDAELRAACAAGYSLCKSSGGGTLTGADGGAPADDCATATKPPATCTATVGQYSACLEEGLAALQSTGAPACDKLTKADLDGLLPGDAGTTSGGPLGNGPACAAFDASCPDFQATAMASGMLRPAPR